MCFRRIRKKNIKNGGKKITREGSGSYIFPNNKFLNFFYKHFISSYISDHAYTTTMIV